MVNEHVTPEQADEYAIGALEPHAERSVALHVLECTECRARITQAQQLASYIALGVPIQKPGRRFRRRVFESAGLSRPGLQQRVGRYAGIAAVGAAALIAVASFTAMLSLRGQVHDLRDANAVFSTRLDEALSQKVEIAAVTHRLSEEERRTFQLLHESQLDRGLLVALMSPQSDVADVFATDEGAVGSLIWDPQQKRIWFVATGLAPRPAGETYQIWANSSGSFVSLGTFNADSSGFVRFDTFVPGGIANYDGALVTIERAGGASERSGASVFVMDLSGFRR